MKSILKLSCVGILLCALPLSAFADASNCEPGQVEKCFMDGDTSKCVCMAEPDEVAENPESEPDGYENPDE